MKKGNIVGEPISKYVNDQIKVRQKVHGDGFNQKRNIEYINFINSQTSWIKLASSVLINPDPNADANKENKLQPKVDGTFRLKDLGLPTEGFEGIGLAKKAILFNGLSRGLTEGLDTDPTIADENFLGYIQRRGITSSTSLWNNKAAYGLGGNEFGLQPMPGITSLSINHLNRGSIRSAKLELKAFNRFQFEIIEILYLRLGYTMMLEWGNNSYIDNATERKESVENALIEEFWFAKPGTPSFEIYKLIEEKRKEYDGNYDGFFGRVSNFNWKYNPDGSYDISIDLMSIGDVIESLKINTLMHPIPQSADSKDNHNDISNYLKSIKNSKQFNLETRNSPFLDLNEAGEIEGGTLVDEDGWWGKQINKLTGDGGKIDSNDLPRAKEEYKNFIRLGDFLKFLKDHIMLYVLNEGIEKFPLIDFDVDNEFNVMSTYPNQFSINPKVCLVNTDYFNPPLKQSPHYFNYMAQFNSYDPVPHGKVMNIYLNFYEIEKQLKANLDGKGNLFLFKFLKGICSSINNALGGINNLEPIIDESRNTIVLIDQNSIPGKEGLLKKLLPEEEQFSYPIDIFGYNTNLKDKDYISSNFVKNFSFETELSPEFASQISIGATANGTVVGEDATAFSKWNQGLTDRFRQEVILPDPPPPITGSSEEEKETKPKAVEVRYSGPEGFASGLTFKALSSSDVAQIQQRRQTLYNSDMKLYLEHAFGRQITGWGNRDQSLSQYTKIDDDFIDRGRNVFKNYFSSVIENEKSRGNSTNTVGFIPVKLSLEIDGLSGVKVYNKLAVNTNFLPTTYTSALEFIIMGVSHNLSENKWETRLEALSIPIVKPILATDIELKKIDLNEFKPYGENIDNRIPINDLSISNNGLNLIKKLESFRSEAYQDSIGVWTIGYGQTRIRVNGVEREVRPGDTINENEAYIYLLNESKEFEKISKLNIIVPMTQNEWDSYISFAWNLGPYKTGKETFLQLLNSKQYIEAGNQMLKYIKAGGEINQGLVNRRVQEVELWFKNNPGNPK